METIDTIRINFNQDQLLFLNICLAFLMFGIALNIKLEDFSRIFQNPKAPIVGLISEYLLLPTIALSLIFIFQPTFSLALGMILISTCPGGSTSNYMVHLSKANTALSVILTSITTLGAIVITPVAFGSLTQFIPGIETFPQNITVEPWEMIKTIIQLILIPVGVGMFLNHRFPIVTQKIERYVRIFSMLIFLGFVVFAIGGNFENIKNHLHSVFFIVLIHNTLALLVGYWFAKWNGLSQKDAQAISIETGIQNTGLGLIIVFNFFDGIGGMAIIVAWWGIWHLVSGFALAMWWGRSRKSSTQ